jgi:hypothetical protein
VCPKCSSNKFVDGSQVVPWKVFWHFPFIPRILLMYRCKALAKLLWGDFSSLYSWFYEVIILESTNATSEGKNASVFLEVRMRLSLKLSNLPPMHHLWLELIDIFSKLKHYTS